MKFKTFIKIEIVVLLLLATTFCYLKYVHPIVEDLIEDMQDAPGE